MINVINHVTKLRAKNVQFISKRLQPLVKTFSNTHVIQRCDWTCEHLTNVTQNE